MEPTTESQTQTTIVSHEQPVKTVRTTKVAQPQIHTEHPQKVYEKKKAIFRTYQIIWYLLSIIEIILAFRIALKMLGANPFSGFTAFIYAASDPFALPFQGILRTNVTAGGSVFEWSTIIAMIVYAIIAAGIVQLIQFFKPVTPTEVSENVDAV